MTDVPAEPVILDLASADTGPTEWLWADRIPIGHPSLIGGDMGIGKSFAVHSLIAAVIKDAPSPLGIEVAHGNVLLLDGENGERELRRRLQACGVSNWDRIQVITSVKVRDTESPLLLERHLELLEKEVVKFRPVWVIIDPLVAFHQSSEIDAVQVRGLFMRLAYLAKTYRIAVTAIGHLNKREQSSALYRFRGSTDFVAAVRSYLEVSVIDDKLRAAILRKTNLVDQSSVPNLGFKVEDGRVVWTGEVNVREKGEGKLEIAMWLLHTLLADGPMEVTLIRDAAEVEGISWRTIQRARERLPIKPRKTSPDGPWKWELLEETKTWGEFMKSFGSTDEKIL